MVTLIRLKKILLIIYLVVLPTSYLYINSVLTKNIIKINEKDNKDGKTTEKNYSIDIKLLVHHDGTETSYKASKKNTDTVEDLLRHLRDHQGFIYEKTEYIYGIEIETVNHTHPNNNYKWAIFDKETNVTKDINSIRLTDNTTYIIKQISSN